VIRELYCNYSGGTRGQRHRDKIRFLHVWPKINGFLILISLRLIKLQIILINFMFLRCGFLNLSSYFLFCKNRYINGINCKGENTFCAFFHLPEPIEF